MDLALFGTPVGNIRPTSRRTLRRAAKKRDSLVAMQKESDTRTKGKKLLQVARTPEKAFSLPVAIVHICTDIKNFILNGIRGATRWTPHSVGSFMRMQQKATAEPPAVPVPPPRSMEERSLSSPASVRPGTPIGNVYAPGEAEERLGIAPLPRITLTPELVAGREALWRNLGREYTLADIKQSNILTLGYYVWPLLYEMVTRTDWRICVIPYDQNNKALSMSFIVSKDAGLPLGDQYGRALWVLVGDDLKEAKHDDALKMRLEKQALRYGCTVDNFGDWDFYKYNFEESDSLEHITKIRGDDSHLQEIVDFIVELLHRDDMGIPVPRWDYLDGIKRIMAMNAGEGVEE
ncbi:unnamed protein product [Vitrella brassicaformis CCMP3155]|uniref:Uncharacterized protein n=1 Tax=Vitrella brassicaformis (strain CCMP3155) TaxID=1169540 RepID=A0A0G4ERY1_VITBC|nr:unnamed protein product [Vitrella brassicaformis CCMP3155]|eukprot:CEL99993.1 unnamed protein product [Vitrella brassicaformis CCMP3155]